jgi:long-chain acyl-CoA synthetase
LSTTAIGGAIGFFSGDPLRLLEDVQILKPHFFPGVPRVLNRIYLAAMAAADVPGFKGDLFRKAYQAKVEKFRATGDNTHFFWDTLVFRKVRQAFYLNTLSISFSVKLRAVLGGRLLLMSSGSAPISRDVIEFLNVAFSCYVTEGM